jgi:hypothetical protein
LDFIPEKSEIQIDAIEIHKDAVLKSMIKDLGIRHLIPGLAKKEGAGRTKK